MRIQLRLFVRIDFFFYLVAVCWMDEEAGEDVGYCGCVCRLEGGGGGRRCHCGGERRRGRVGGVSGGSNWEPMLIILWKMERRVKVWRGMMGVGLAQAFAIEEEDDHEGFDY